MRKGIYPGGRKAGVFDERVWRGGASRGRAEELRVEEEERVGGKKDGGLGGRRRARGRRMDGGYDGGVGGGRGGQGYEGYGGRGRDGVGYRGDGRSEMSEGLDRRRTILGEVSGRY